MDISLPGADVPAALPGTGQLGRGFDRGTFWEGGVGSNWAKSLGRDAGGVTLNAEELYEAWDQERALDAG
jgi:hypothetical protein